MEHTVCTHEYDHHLFDLKLAKHSFLKSGISNALGFVLMDDSTACDANDDRAEQAQNKL